MAHAGLKRSGGELEALRPKRPSCAALLVSNSANIQQSTPMLGVEGCRAAPTADAAAMQIEDTPSPVRAVGDVDSVAWFPGDSIHSRAPGANYVAVYYTNV